MAPAWLEWYNADMPTVLRIGPYRFFFYAGDAEEPVHIHCERDEHTAKFWLDPVHLDRSKGFGSSEINRVQEIVEEHRDTLVRRWHEFFNH